MRRAPTAGALWAEPRIRRLPFKPKNQKLQNSDLFLTRLLRLAGRAHLLRPPADCIAPRTDSSAVWWRR